MTRTFIRNWVVAALAVVAMFASVAPTADASPSHSGGTTHVTRYSGFVTAVTFSQMAFPDGADEVLLTRVDLFADALSAGSAYGRPLLLTHNYQLASETSDELKRLGASKVTILGGPNAVYPAVEQELRRQGYTVQRLSGTTRISTSVAISEHYHPDTSGSTPIIARATGNGTQAFADTLGGSALAMQRRAPVLLTPTESLAPEVRNYLVRSNASKVLIAGGPTAVSPTVEQQLKNLGLTVVRVAGPTRVSTANKQNSARGFARAADAKQVLLVNGYLDWSWVTGFSAASWAANNQAAVVLSDTDGLSAEAQDFLRYAPNTKLVCGPWVTDSTCDAAYTRMANKETPTVNQAYLASGGAGGEVRKGDVMKFVFDEAIDRSTLHSKTHMHLKWTYNATRFYELSGPLCDGDGFSCSLSGDGKTLTMVQLRERYGSYPLYLVDIDVRTVSGRRIDIANSRDVRVG